MMTVTIVTMKEHEQDRLTRADRCVYRRLRGDRTGSANGGSANGGSANGHTRDSADTIAPPN
jgi:hypothetical protein